VVLKPAAIKATAIKTGPSQSMIALSSQRFVGVSQADETRGERSERVNHAIKHRDRAFSGRKSA
jgi:hypothetical protein